ncbi:MAG TPA: 30S ribosomal protein S4 [Aggregatilineales bacterium]|nr:30S ribosomal protein S4 [Aggregatilineales bacterium]
MGNPRPKAKQMRRFGEVLVSRPKYQRILEKRPYPPGAHGKEKSYRRGRQSDYALQLEEKQKLAFIYNIRERQMLRYYLKASQMPGVTGSNLLVLLESRLDNLCYKLGFGTTIWHARQLVNHGHILVDGRKLDIASYSVVPGQTITLRERMRQNPDIEVSLDARGPLPDFLKYDEASFTGRLDRLPQPEEIQVPVNEQLVVEFYSRKT